MRLRCSEERRIETLRFGIPVFDLKRKTRERYFEQWSIVTTFACGVGCFVSFKEQGLIMIAALNNPNTTVPQLFQDAKGRKAADIILESTNKKSESREPSQSLADSNRNESVAGDGGGAETRKDRPSSLGNESGAITDAESEAFLDLLNGV